MLAVPQIKTARRGTKHAVHMHTMNREPYKEGLGRKHMEYE